MSKISVEEAAKQMGVTPMFVRMGLRTGRLPFGVAVKFEKRWRYHINPERFRRWMAGDDLTSVGGEICESRDIQVSK